MFFSTDYLGDDKIDLREYIKRQHFKLLKGDPKVLKEAISPYFLRRRKKDALPDLPEKVHEEIWLDLKEKQREHYDLAERKGVINLNELGDRVTVQHVLALITKLKQICNLDPVSKEGCKLEYLEEQLEELTEVGDKALVYSQYPMKTLAQIEARLSRFNPLLYHGTLPGKVRDKIVEDFQEKDDHQVLLMSVKAGGLGLTLTRANYVFHFDRWWNPATATQAEDRTHRIGQTKTVFVISLFTVGTIEERIQQILERKRHLFDEIVDDLSMTDLKKVMTEEELFGLFNLKKVKRE